MTEQEPPSSLVELRLLEGPNLYFPRAAAKLTLDASRLTGCSPDDARAVAASLGLGRVRPGDPGTTQRQAFSLRLVRLVARRIATRGGATRLALRARPGAEHDQLVLAYPWRNSGRAEVLGYGVAEVVDRCVDAPGDTARLQALVIRMGDELRSAALGRGPASVRPRIPVVSVTGTNGKTTTTRLVAHACMTAGYRTGWSSTDGVVVQGEMVEEGDYSGPAGGRRVLESPGVERAVLETARGGLLLKGMGITRNDVSVVTNVSADHLGMHGIDTLDQLAEVKAIVTQVTRTRGWTVLNGDDPRVLAMRAGSPGQPFVFSLDPESPALREAINNGGRAITVMDGAITVLAPGSDPQRLVDVVDVPMTLSGLSCHNLANALAGAAASLGLALSREAVVEALRTFLPDAELNPGRMNLYTVPLPLPLPSDARSVGTRTGSCTVVVDLAHNEAGLEALLAVARGVAAPGARVILGLGAVGDRAEEVLTALGEIAGVGADRLAVVHKDRYLRGKTRDELEDLLRRGAAAVGVHDVPAYPTELEGAKALVGEAGDGDVVALMVHADRQGVGAWLRSVGATPDDPDTVRAKVVTARGLHPVEDEIASATALEAPERLAAVRALAKRHPGDARLSYELASAHDVNGLEAEAIPLYREALDAGLLEPHRTNARVGLASSLRVLGQPEEALTVLDELLEERPGSTAGAAFRALVLHSLGRHDEAVAQAVEELSRHLGGSDAEGYEPALRHYAEELQPSGETD